MANHKTLNSAMVCQVNLKTVKRQTDISGGKAVAATLATIILPACGNTSTEPPSYLPYTAAAKLPGAPATRASGLADDLKAAIGQIEKNEYETTEQYRERLKTPLLGNPPGAPIAVILDAALDYDADGQLAKFCGVPDFETREGATCDGDGSAVALYQMLKKVEPRRNGLIASGRTILRGTRSNGAVVRDFAFVEKPMSLVEAKNLDGQRLRIAYIVAFDGSAEPFSQHGSLGAGVASLYQTLSARAVKAVVFTDQQVILEATYDAGAQ